MTRSAEFQELRRRQKSTRANSAACARSRGSEAPRLPSRCASASSFPASSATRRSATGSSGGCVRECGGHGFQGCFELGKPGVTVSIDGRRHRHFCLARRAHDGFRRAGEAALQRESSADAQARGGAPYRAGADEPIDRFREFGMEDKRNLFTAIGLSLLVLVGWQYFVTPRFVTPKPAQIETQQEGNPASTPQASTFELQPQAAPQAPPPGTTAATPTSVTQEISREDALKSSPRVAIHNDHLSGSIALKGARFDDLTLDELSRDAPLPTARTSCFSRPRARRAPSTRISAFFRAPLRRERRRTPIRSGRRAAMSSPPKTPITLTWTNPQGVEFKREIAVDDDYMFTVTDTVTNHAAQTLSVYPLCGRGAAGHAACRGLLRALRGLARLYRRHAASRNGPTPSSIRRG